MQEYLINKTPVCRCITHLCIHNIRLKSFDIYCVHDAIHTCCCMHTSVLLQARHVQHDAVLKCLASPAFGRTADALRAECGHAAHPTLVLQELGRQGHDLCGPTTSKPRRGLPERTLNLMNTYDQNRWVITTHKCVRLMYCWM